MSRKKIIKVGSLRCGFTMIEVMVAVFIIAIGVLASYTVIQGFIYSAHQSALRLEASYLAQEGIEIVNNIRNENWVNQRDWRAGLPAGNWEADYTSHSLLSQYSDNDFLSISNNGFYGYGHSRKIPFQRKISISYDNNDKMDVAVSVYWQYQGKTKGPFVVKEILYNWYK